MRSLVVHSRPGRTITLITATGRTPIMGPAVTASGMVTPGYLPVSYEQQLPRYRTIPDIAAPFVLSFTPSTNFCFRHHAQINLSSISAHALLIRVKCDRLRIKQGRRETWFSGNLANG